MMNSVPADFSTPVFYYLLKTLGPKVVVSSLLAGASCSKGAPATTVSKVKVTTKDDDDFDLFGEETEEDKAAQEELAASALAAAKAKEGGAKKKKVVINKSTLVIEIKPNSLETDLDVVQKLVREIKLDGLEWSAACQKVPIAFGLCKLQIGCVIVDDLINTEDIIEHIESIGMTEEQIAKYKQCRESGSDAGNEDDEEEEAPGMVQSACIVSFQKL